MTGLTVADSLPLGLDNNSSLSPPKLLPFWEQLDVASDKAAVTMDEVFAASDEDDPPFISFEYNPTLDNLSDLCDVGFSGCSADSSQTLPLCQRSADGTVVDCDSDGPCSPLMLPSHSYSNATMSEGGQLIKEVDNEVDFPHASPCIQHGFGSAAMESHGTSAWKSCTTRTPGYSSVIRDKVAGSHVAIPGTPQSTSNARKSRRVLGKDVEFDREKSCGTHSHRKSSSTADKCSEIHSASSEKFLSSTVKLLDIANSPASQHDLSYKLLMR